MKNTKYGWGVYEYFYKGLTDGFYKILWFLHKKRRKIGNVLEDEGQAVPEREKNRPKYMSRSEIEPATFGSRG